MGWILDYSALFSLILSNSLKASLLAGLILLVKFFLRFRIGARVQYLLWFIVVIRLILPWAPESSFSIYNLIQSDKYEMPPIVQQRSSMNLNGETSLASEGLNQNKLNDKAISSPAPSPSSPNNGLVTVVNPPSDEIKNHDQGAYTWKVDDILFSVWLIGACLLAVYTVLRNRAFGKQLDARLIKEEGLISSLDEVKSRLNIKRRIPLMQTSQVSTPSLYGIFQPKLLMPEKVQEKLSLDQMTYVFAHELCHFKRKDVLVNWFVNALVILHWFNPMIWYIAYRLREDQEVACDATALSYIGNDKSKDYGYTLLSLLESCTKAKHVTSLTSLSGSKSQLKRRVIMLKLLGKVSVKWTLVGILILLAISFTALTNAKEIVPNTPDQSSSNVAERENEVVTVNSAQPAKLQPELVEYARTHEGNLYSFSTADDLPSIALGAYLGIWDRVPSYEELPIIQKQAAELVPGNPIVVKSYDLPFNNYYVVPMLKESKFVGSIIFSERTLPGNEEKEAQMLSSFEYNSEKEEFSARDKLVDIDGSDAMDIVKKKQGISEVPVPRLVRKSESKQFHMFNLQEFLWEFNFEGNKVLHVNQQGEVLDTDIRPWYEKYVSPKYDPKEVKLESNKLTRDDGWSINVQSIEFGESLPYDPTLKSVSIYLIIRNDASEDQIFMPKGSIISVTSNEGKTYPIPPIGLESGYIGIQELRIEQKQTGIEPGLLKFAPVLWVDSAESNITKVTYRDEQGNEFEIPVELTPELKVSPPKINGTMEPYKIQDKDWSLAITQLEFRHSTNNKFILAALAFTLTSNNGEDTIFSPKGKILGITGTSGKFYPYDYSLEQAYADLLEKKKERAKETGQLYQPGVMTIYPEISIDVGEKNISKIIYQDENGKKFEIPVSGISPVSR